MIDLRPTVLRSLVACAVLAGLLSAPLLAAAPALAQAEPPMKTIGAPSKKKGSESLIVLNAAGAKLAGQKLVLEGTSPSAILFTDRPARGAGHVALREVVDLWSSGSFAKDPPNATVSAFARDGSAIGDAVVVLTAPRLDGARLTFDVAVLEGDLGKGDGPAAIFIDTIWFGIGSGGVSYLGQNQTTGGTSPAFGSANDTSAMTGWSNPAPDAPPRPSRRYNPLYDSGLAAPPGSYPGGAAPAAQCGAPPLLPCY